MNYPNKFKDHNTLWFESEVLPHEDDLRKWIESSFPTIEDPEDLIQDAYFRLMKAYTSGSIPHPRAYLFVTVKNMIYSRFRCLKYNHPKNATSTYQVNILDKTRSPSEIASDNDDIRVLVDAFRSLPKKCCQVMTLRKIYGFSQKEVADKLGISVNTVQVQARIGLKKCREYFKQVGYKGGNR